jgi:hypothetical protein
VSRGTSTQQKASKSPSSPNLPSPHNNQKYILNPIAMQSTHERNIRHGTIAKEQSALLLVQIWGIDYILQKQNSNMSPGIKVVAFVQPILARGA